MSTFPTDRRHPRITVTEVRRDLREADEDRFQLKAAVVQRGSQAEQGRRPPRSTHLLGIVLAVGAGVLSAVGMTQAPEARITQSAALPPAPSHPDPIAAPLESAPPEKPETPLFRKARTAPRAAKRQSVPVSWKSRPRPQSPGEFGRLAAAHPSN